MNNMNQSGTEILEEYLDLRTKLKSSEEKLKRHCFYLLKKYSLYMNTIDPERKFDECKHRFPYDCPTFQHNISIQINTESILLSISKNDGYDYEENNYRETLWITFSELKNENFIKESIDKEIREKEKELRKKEEEKERKKKSVEKRELSLYLRLSEKYKNHN